MLCSGNESSPSPSTGEESSKISNSLPTNAFFAFRRRIAVARMEAADWSLASPDRRPGLPLSPRSSNPGTSFISCISNIEHLRWDRGGWMAWMPENGGGRDARSMAPTTASAPPLVGYLVSNCSSGFKPAFFRPYLPRGSWKCRKSGVRLFLDLICVRFILLGFAGALRLFVFQQKWRRHGQSENG